MKSISRIMRKLLAFGLLPATAVVLTGCDGFIFEDEGDCDPYYKVRFRYDRNLKFADAFAAEVDEVTLYVADAATGRIVWQKHESGNALKQAGYLMDVDVRPGNYTLVAWCGEGHRTSFGVDDGDNVADLRCRLESRTPAADGKGGDVTEDLGRLYHGCVENVNFTDEQGVHVYDVALTKNTNSVKIVLQHLSGEKVDDSDFHFTITDSNGLMDWDNSLLEDERLTYHAWETRSGMAGVDVPDYTDSRAVTHLGAAVASHTVGRMVKGHDMRVNVYNRDGETVVSVPLIDYALLVKGKYSRELTDQEYLDYQDEYSMVFFLDERDRWIDSYIYINSWRVVLQDTDL